MKLLIADDNFIAREMLKYILLKNEGWRVYEAESGKEAWDMLKDGLRPHVCLFDISMPNTDGIMLTEKMRSNPLFTHIPIILITIEKDKEVIKRAATLGVAAYILKPYQAENVVQEVMKAGANIDQKKLDEAKILADPVLMSEQTGIPLSRYFMLLDHLIMDVEKNMPGLAMLSHDRLTGLQGACYSLGAYEIADALERYQEVSLPYLEGCLKELKLAKYRCQKQLQVN
jgi:two-component system chemotaxis response regulator CheY